jgi:RNA polymerase sigma factor (sigma-70 family)
VVNICRSRLRRRSIERRVNATVHLRAGREPNESAPDSGSPLVIAVRALPVRQRTAVVLHYYADMSQADVAEVMGCSEGTVKSQLSKARSTLARALDDRDGSGDD